MRQLNAKQKKVLTDYFNACPTSSKPFDWEDLPWEICNKMRDLNDHETLESNVSRFVSDMFFVWANS